MMKNEPEIVTNRQVEMLKEDCNYWPGSKNRELINTIELFAGLLEESCWLGCDEDDGELCEPCQRKAAALRRYRGGVIAMRKMENRKLTPSSDFHQDEPLAYLVKCFDTTIHEYKVFANDYEAEHYAHEQEEAASEAGEPEDWLVYPLYAGHGLRP